MKTCTKTNITIKTVTMN